MSDTGYQPYCEKCGAPVVWCTCLDDIDWSPEMRSYLGRVRLEQQVKELRAELARRDEIITRLKEDAERLASTYVVEAFPHEWVCRGGCHHWARFGEQIDHAPDCPIALHRALMKELEVTNG